MEDAYQAWHCGNGNCSGEELDDKMCCPACGREYRSDGSLISDED